MQSRRRSSHIFLVLAFFALVPLLLGQQECVPTGPDDGGGGGGGGGGGAIPASILDLEQDAYALVNQERAAYGLSALIMDESVRAVARAHSQDMANRGYFSHDTPEGVTSSQRLTNAGVAWRMMGENIAKNMGYADPAYVAVDGWMDSTGHRANILTGDFTHTGMGVAIDADGYTIFTQVFVTP